MGVCRQGLVSRAGSFHWLAFMWVATAAGVDDGHSHVLFRRRDFTTYLPVLWLLNSFCASSEMFPEPSGVGVVDTGVLSMAENMQL